MSLRVYNTLTRTKEVFEPGAPWGKVGMYLCGPTVYKSPHIGHMVGPVIFDTIKRFLKYKGFDVTFVVNITDVDDKIINHANKVGQTSKDVAERYTAEYFAALQGLGIANIDRFPKVSEHMPEILKLTQDLIGKGFAYAADGNVWFDVAKDAEYGKLSGRKLQDQESGTRGLEGSGKKNAADFALWKAAKPGEPAWDSPWGKGRPGWHIECSAMAIKYLGETFDIHGGGDDLKFPHHENELAQSECCTGKPFARYWLHNGLTTINTKKLLAGGEEASKISGEELTKDTDEARKMREMVDFAGLLKRHGAELIRYLILCSHYRRPINFGEDVIESANKSLAAFHRLFERAQRLGVLLDDAQVEVDQASRTLLEVASVEEFIRTLLNLKMKWLEMMDDDFNTAGAIAVMHEIVTATNGFIDASRVESTRDATVVQAISASVSTLRKLGKLFGLLDPSAKPAIADDLSPKLMDLLIALRKEARESKNFALADSIRKRLTDIGVSLEDNKDGTIWRKS